MLTVPQRKVDFCPRSVIFLLIIFIWIDFTIGGRCMARSLSWNAFPLNGCHSFNGCRHYFLQTVHFLKKNYFYFLRYEDKQHAVSENQYEYGTSQGMEEKTEEITSNTMLPSGCHLTSILKYAIYSEVKLNKFYFKCRTWLILCSSLESTDLNGSQTHTNLSRHTTPCNKYTCHNIISAITLNYLSIIVYVFLVPSKQFLSIKAWTPQDLWRWHIP